MESEKEMSERHKRYMILAAVIALTAAHYVTALGRIEVHDLFRRLYFVPVILGAYFFGVRGGITTALTVSFLYLPFIVFKIHLPEEKFDQVLELIVINAMGMLTGLLSQRQKQAIHRLENLMLGVIQSMVATIEAKDEYTKGHSLRVMRYAEAIGRGMNLPQLQMKMLRIGALLHDFGKIAIDLSVLNKPSSLSKNEMSVMHKHPELGAKILESIDEIHEALPAILYHHEKFDGSGYPQGLKADQIPLLARIVTAADVFDAITTDRPYQKARSFDQALIEVQALADSMLDPAIVKLVLSKRVQEEFVRQNAGSHFSGIDFQTAHAVGGKSNANL